MMTKRKVDTYKCVKGVNLTNEDGTETRYEAGDYFTTDDVTTKQLAALFALDAVVAVED